MTALRWLVAAAVLGTAGMARAGGSADDSLAAASWDAAATVTLTHVTGPIYVGEDTYYAKENAAVYIGPKTVTVIGATWTPETARLLREAIAKLTPNPVTEVVNTNYHPHRAGGNAYWKANHAAILATNRTRDLMKRQWKTVLDWTREAFPDYPELEPVLPTRTFHGDFELQEGRIRALYLGPSHTPDGIFVYFPAEKVLYGGCILKEELGNLKFADLREYPRTLRRLQNLHLPIETIIAGHGSPIHGPDLIPHFLSLLDQVPAR